MTKYAINTSPRALQGPCSSRCLSTAVHLRGEWWTPLQVVLNLAWATHRCNNVVAHMRYTCNIMTWLRASVLKARVVTWFSSSVVTFGLPFTIPGKCKYMHVHHLHMTHFLYILKPFWCSLGFATVQRNHCSPNIHRPPVKHVPSAKARLEVDYKTEWEN